MISDGCGGMLDCNATQCAAASCNGTTFTPAGTWTSHTLGRFGHEDVEIRHAAERVGRPPDRDAGPVAADWVDSHVRMVVVLLAGGADASDERNRLVVPIEDEVALEAVIVVAPSRVLREERPDLFVGKAPRRPRNRRWRAAAVGMWVPSGTVSAPV